MRKIVVTGLGLITTLGEGVEETWNNLLSCKSGIKKITSFDTSDLPCKIAGFLSNDINSENFLKLENYFEKKEINRNDRFILYGLAAAQLAIKDANIENLKIMFSNQRLSVPSARDRHPHGIRDLPPQGGQLHLESQMVL